MTDKIIQITDTEDCTLGLSESGSLYEMNWPTKEWRWLADSPKIGEDVKS